MPGGDAVDVYAYGYVLMVIGLMVYGEKNVNG